ncbi:hypothetical protein OIV83_000500 [Microbotryomycetes sp. JL201]|nr:hypothetical protein OIV83_000500 [Microbotryomycetes sp. JL201]
MSNPTRSSPPPRQLDDPPSKSILQDVISSIFEPGTNSGLIKAMTYSFYSLFATLLVMLVLTNGNLHVLSLLVLSVGLFASVKWFLVQIAEEEEKQRQQRKTAQETMTEENRKER